MFRRPSRLVPAPRLAVLREKRTGKLIDVELKEVNELYFTTTKRELYGRIRFELHTPGGR